MDKRDNKDYIGIQEHFYPEFIEFLSEFVKESDRAAVILGAAKIDSLLGKILEKYLLPCPGSSDDLLEGDSPLSTFSARIRVCHRLGLIDDSLAKMLQTFRKLRNGFAHDVTHSTLSMGSARDRVNSIAEPLISMPMFITILDKLSKSMSKPKTDVSVMFRAALVFLYFALSAALEQIKPAKLQIKSNWVAALQLTE